MIKLVSQMQVMEEAVPPLDETLRANCPSLFSAEIRLRAPHLYAMVVQDPTHYLLCELILEIQPGQHDGEYGAVICHFPKISDKQLKAFVGEDETLCGMIMMQFQMKLLKQLLLFCANHNASNLIFYVDDDQAEDLGIYQDFVVCENQVLTPQGEKTELIILTDPEIFDDWLQYMDQVTTLFRQTLWQDQRVNPAIRHYLKTHKVFEF